VISTTTRIPARSATCYPAGAGRVAHLCLIVGLAVAPALARQGATFTTSTIDPTNAGDCKALADLDGDGKADVIVGGPSLCWYESGAAFAKHLIRSSPISAEFTTGMQAADVDGDGDIDLIIPDSGPSNTGTVYWFENPRINPPAGHASELRVGANWTYHVIGVQGAVVHDLEVADLDNDGRVDVVASGHGVAHVWKQMSPTTWSGKDISSVAGSGISIGDIDLDGFRDIATPSGWLRNPHDIINGAWTRFIISQAGSGDACLVVDLDGDGHPDLMTCPAHARGPMVWFQAPANPTSSAWTMRTIDPSMGAHHPEAVDIDRDGRMDILMGLETRDLSVYTSNGGSPPTFTKIQLDTQCGHNARAGDIDGDGMPDVLGCDYIGNPPVRVYINNLNAAPPCYANCDASQTSPILNANDFQCFLSAFATGLSYANCDGSTVLPVLNANDFQCYLNSFGEGCPA
jgi:hypothetical protein